MKPPPRSMRPCRPVFPALATALLLSMVTGASPATVPPSGSVDASTDNALAADNAVGSDNAAGLDNAVGSDNAAGLDNAVGLDIDLGSAVPVADNTWVDRSHSWVGRGLFDAVVWFDQFFGDERVVLAERPEAYLRWKTELRWDEVEHTSFRSSVRASLRLPRMKKRWRLVFTSESQGDPNAVIPEDPGNPGLDPASQVRTSSTALIYDIFRTQRSVLDAGVGVRVKIPPDAFVRTRFQYARPLAVDILGRLTVTAYWDAQDGPGESNQVDLERWFAPLTLLRWSNSFTIEEQNKINGWAWGTDLSLLHTFSPKSAITFSGGASGSTQPAWIAQDYRVLVRYRRNVWREWLFLEGEPDIHWPRQEDGSRKPVWGATLRAEILFSGAGWKSREGGGSRP